MNGKLLFLAALAFILGAIRIDLAFAQGVTTASMNGTVVDDSGEPVPGATVIALHQPTGTQYGNVTNNQGLFTIRNMNVGGPYKLTVSFVGFETQERDNIFLSLGQTTKQNFTISETTTELAELVITSETSVFDGNRNGATTVVDERTINELPTVARAIGDFARLTPQANVQEGDDGFTISIGGMNNRYNTIFIDGAVNNDVFGLAGSGTNGGQTGVTPISIDAIEQFQISVAPFDVRQSGFAGGAINAVTRSGSNEFEGSAYYFLRNESIAGETPTDNTAVPQTKLPDFTAKTYGLRLGGPIIRNKLFFFVSGEVQRDETPQPFNFADYRGNATAADLNALVSKLNGFGYDPGVFDNNTAFLDSDKLLLRLDWNIHQNHKLSLRHSYTDVENLEADRSDNNTINFRNNSEFFPSTTNSTSLEIKSTFGNDKANSLILGYTRVRDDRDPFGQDFPWVEIMDGDGTIFFGSEQFSTANRLDQDIFTITNNFELFKGKHTITLGTHNEFYDVLNLFIPFNFGSYEYTRSTPIGNSNLEDFLNDENSSFFIRSFSLIDDVVGDGSQAAAVFNAAQLGFYVQDEIQVNDKLRFTAGVRVDIPIFEDTPVNEDLNNNAIPAIESFGYDLDGARSGQFIKTQFMVAPRVGFNYDVRGDQTTQLRGGVGIFNSRVPLVWPGGAYNNYGLNRGTDLRFGDLPFEPDPNNQFQSVEPGTVQPSGDIDLFVEDFKVPQVMKLNLAVDHKLPWGLIGTIEGLYTKFLNNVAYQNVNLKPSTNRMTGTPDDRIIYDRRDEIDDTYSRVLLASNTNDGYAFNITAQITKPFDNGLSASIAYTYGDAFTVFDGTSSQNSSQWRGLYSVNGRNFNQMAARSDFSPGSRIVGQVSYRKEYAGFLATQISLFYNGQSGVPYSFIYNDGGGLTSEDSRERSLIYVPASSNEIVLVQDGDRTPEQQWNDLNAYIENDDYLRDRRGRYTERNESRLPFESILDLRFLQDFFIETGGGKRNTLQFSLDIFNFSNLLNDEWGRRYFVRNDNIELIDFAGFAADGTTPTFTFDGEAGEADFRSIDDSGVRSSRWQMQMGVRYIFGN